MSVNPGYFQPQQGHPLVCTTDGTAGTWRKLAGPGTAGAFHVLPTPVRVYDSRMGTSPSQGPKTPLAANMARTLDLTVNTSTVPTGATAAMVNVLLVHAAVCNGNFTVWANGATRPLANTMVWAATPNDSRPSPLRPWARWPRCRCWPATPPTWCST